MRVLVYDEVTKSFIVQEVYYADSDDAISCDNTTYFFDNVLRFFTVDYENENNSDGDTIYVAIKDSAHMEQLLESLLSHGYLNLKAYAETTFIGPDERDVERLEKLCIRKEEL